MIYSGSMARQWDSIKKRSGFLALQKAGYRAGAKRMLWQWDRQADLPDGSWHVGITVTRKIGNSVIRNRCKRRIRALMDRLLAEHSASIAKLSRKQGGGGIRLSIIARHGVDDADYARLLADGRYLMHQIRVSLKPPAHSDSASDSPASPPSSLSTSPSTSGGE